MEEYVVTLWRHEDLEAFYEDMETPGGSVYIPNRSVELTARRNISRNTHYMLTPQEAELVKSDPRVRDVESMFILNLSKVVPSGYAQTGNFNKSIFSSADYLNWGLIRHTERDNRSNWGRDGTADLNDTVTITASGENVDVVIFDGHCDPSHPEFAVNTDGSGGSRVNQYNWFQNDVGFGTGTYVYTPYVDAGDADRTSDNNHGCHVAGTVAGSKYGWARSANIYNISVYSTNQNFGTLGLSSATMWDYVRAWHNNKPINPNTGRRNPTITNHSYAVIASTETYKCVRINYRGVDFNPGRDLTVSELQERGCYATSDTFYWPSYSTSRQSDIEDAINDGMIAVFAGGNEYWKTVNSTDQDWNNLMYINVGGIFYGFYLHRGGGSGQFLPAGINVGNVEAYVDQRKRASSNCGNQIDLFAAGSYITSSLHSGGISDPRNASYDIGKYSGTSMASPQVAGVLACLAESWQGITQSEAQQWLIDNSSLGKMLDTETDDAMDVQSLQDAENRLLYWFNQRPTSGASYPLKTLGRRTAGKKRYPRPKIRRKG